jgi:predicted outer membrane repeat protein
MYNINNSSPDFTDVTFSGNTASERGGGMYNDANSSPTLSNVTFNGNTARYGGGMYNTNDITPTLTNVTFSNNTASSMGGGMYNIDCSPNLTNVTFNSNTATGDGGGMYNAYGMNRDTSPNLTNVTFSGNTADNGGGMYNGLDSSPTLSNVTFNGNTASERGGGMYNASDCSPTLENVILWGDSAGTSGDEMFNYDSSTTPTITDSVVAGGWPPTGDPTCTNIITNNPDLGTLADNGGPTKTIALGTNSSAIDAGGANTTCASTDQRGAARPFDGDNTGGAVCDIGAYEVRESLTVGDCSSLLDGPQTFNFIASGNTVTVTVDTGDGLTCITVEEMGPGASHPMATEPGPSDDALLTGNWWHIIGNITSGFSVDITLPYSSADADSRVCRWPGDLGGYGWDCDDGTNTSFGTGTVTRTAVDSFSDWAVGDRVGPTAVTLTTFAVDNAIWLPVGLLAIGAAGVMLVRRRRSL